MLRKIRATWLQPISSPLIKDGLIILDQTGRIQALGPASNFDCSDAENYDGMLLPAFVNAHCHLELSHLKGAVPTGTGLLSFIKGVVSQRANHTEAQIQQAIEQADAQMWERGIQAVGDISNQTDSFAVKASSKLCYYTFVECFDFWQGHQAGAAFEQYYKVWQAHPQGERLRASLVPHAPYSVSPQLFEALDTWAKAQNGPLSLSIHNQETLAENALFLNKTGGFLPFYQEFNMGLDDFKAKGTTAIHYPLEYWTKGNRYLFVHNTLTTQADIRAAQAWSERVYWVSCPNANLYIENRLPDYRHFVETSAKVCLGTDSLTSNWQLCILEEIKTILRYQSYLPQDLLLRWATLNGAEALGWEAELGSLDLGKQSGLILLQGLGAQGQIVAETQVRRLV